MGGEGKRGRGGEKREGRGKGEGRGKEGEEGKRGREGRGSSVETGERVSDTDGCNGSVRSLLTGKALKKILAGCISRLPRTTL